MAYKIEIELTDLQAKVWAMFVSDPQEIAENFVRNEVRRCEDAIYAEELERLMADPEVDTIPADRNAIINMSTRKSAKEVDAEMLEKMRAMHETPGQ